MADAYERQFRKGSRVTTMDYYPILGTVTSVYRSSDAGERSYRRLAEVTWDDDTATTVSTPNLVAGSAVVRERERRTCEGCRKRRACIAMVVREQGDDDLGQGWFCPTCVPQIAGKHD
jgi:hypothetical protein